VFCVCKKADISREERPVNQSSFAKTGGKKNRHRKNKKPGDQKKHQHLKKNNYLVDFSARVRRVHHRPGLGGEPKQGSQKIKYLMSVVVQLILKNTFKAKNCQTRKGNTQHPTWENLQKEPGLDPHPSGRHNGRKRLQPQEGKRHAKEKLPIRGGERQLWGVPR